VSGTRLSPTLLVIAGRVCCASCGAAIAASHEPWKARAALDERPVASLGPAYDTGDDGVVLRRFACPACGSLLDTETAMPGDPHLDDRLGSAPG
jgi:acetone carboxylase gamma subunit